MALLFAVVALLIASNAFMTWAWYDHLRNRESPLVPTILFCWLIALPEYALQVPANRLGFGTLSATQLKVIQEVVSLSVFVVFAWWRLGESPSWRTAAAFVLIVLAVAIVRGGSNGTPVTSSSVPETAVASAPPS